MNTIDNMVIRSSSIEEYKTSIISELDLIVSKGVVANVTPNVLSSLMNSIYAYFVFKAQFLILDSLDEPELILIVSPRYRCIVISVERYNIIKQRVTSTTITYEHVINSVSQSINFLNWVWPIVENTPYWYEISLSASTKTRFEITKNDIKFIYGSKSMSILSETIEMLLAEHLEFDPSIEQSSIFSIQTQTRHQIYDIDETSKYFICDLLKSDLSIILDTQSSLIDEYNNFINNPPIENPGICDGIADGGTFM